MTNQNAYSEKQLAELVDAAVRRLREYADSVHIFVTLHDDYDGGTFAYNKGDGNIFARAGQVAAWVSEGIETQLLDENGEPLADEGEEDEE